MIEFRNEMKKPGGKEASKDAAMSDEDDKLFSDEVQEAKLLLKMMQPYEQMITQHTHPASRLPDGVKKRVAHLQYSLKLRQTFVMYVTSRV